METLQKYIQNYDYVDPEYSTPPEWYFKHPEAIEEDMGVEEDV